MNISKVKLVWKFLTGGGTGVVDYVIEVANNAVNSLDEGSRENLAAVVDALRGVLGTARSLTWLVPSKWRIAYSVTLSAFADVVSACEDMQVTRDELEAVVTAWQKAYSAWRAE